MLSALKERLSLLIVGFSILIIGYISAYKEVYYLPYTSYTDPALFLSFGIILSTVLSCLVSKNVSKKWLKSTLIFLVLILLIIFTLPQSTNIGDPTPTKEIGGLALSVMFFLWSMGYLGYHMYKEKNNL